MLRFATSPTSDMHISDLRIAIFNYLISKQKNEDLIVRIEDTDKEKNIEGKDQEILDLLELFGIEYSQIIYQSESARFHSAMALQLIHEKKAFSCFCSDAWLDKKRLEAKNEKKDYLYDDACRNLHPELVIDNTNPFTIRINRPDSPITIKDYIKGDVKFDVDSLDSFLIMNHDKTPLYNFATAVDDMLNDISVVIRSEESLVNAPKQEHIREMLSYDKKIEYAHIPNILLNETEVISVKKLLEDGFLPDAIVNYLISTGNRPKTEIFKLHDAIEWFDLEKVSNSPTPFDYNALKDINRKHLLNLDSKELSRYVGFADDSIGNLAKAYLDEIGTTKELKEKIAQIFAPKSIDEEYKESVETLRSIIKNAPYFKEYKEFKEYLLKESTLDEERLTSSLHLLLSGVEDSISIEKKYKYLKDYLGEIVK
jgi:glutamyl-tRNA synthetase